MLIRIRRNLLCQMTFLVLVMNRICGAVAAGPGSGSGGGDYDPDRPVTELQVRETIVRAWNLVPFVLNYYETIIVNARANGTSGNRAVSKSTMGLLFPWPKPGPDAQEKWHEIHLRIDQEKPCYNSAREEKAASAYPFESLEICVSLPVILGHASSATLLRRLTALLVHELSHKMGLNDETEAWRLEAEINANLPTNFEKVLSSSISSLFLQAQDAKGSFTDHLNRVINEITRSQRGGALDWGEICYDLSSISVHGEEFGYEADVTGYAFETLRPIDRAEELSIRRRSSVLQYYCNAHEKAVPGFAAGAGKETRNVNLGESGVLSIARGLWRRPRYHDPIRLREELGDIQSSLGRVRQALGEASSELSVR